MTTYTLVSTNNAITTLAAPITDASPSLQVTGGAGALFPALAANQAFICTLIKSGAPNTREIIVVYSRSGDNFTSIGRGFEGTTALSWSAGDIVSLRPTAYSMNTFVQPTEAQQQGYNFGADSGSANNYRVVLSPQPNASIIGMPLRFIAQHPNTGPSTFSDDINTLELYTTNGQLLVLGDIVGGAIYEVNFRGDFYFLTNVYRYAFSQLAGQIANAQVPVGAVTQWQASLAIAWSQLTGAAPTNLNLPGAATIGVTPATGDSSAKIADTAFVNPGSAFGVSNYRKNPDGSIHQWGRITVSGTTTLTFPVTFPIACRSVTLTNIASTNQINVQGTPSASQAIFTNGNADVFWEADGN